MRWLAAATAAMQAKAGCQDRCPHTSERIPAMPVRMARRMGDGEESDAGEATSAKERSQHTIHHKAHVSIVKEWARKAAV